MHAGRLNPLTTPDTFPLISLLNVLFLALLVLMSVVGYSAMEADVSIQLPSIEGAEPRLDRQQGEIYINVQQDGSVVINNQPVEISELQNVLARVAEHFPEGAVIIRGDQNATLKRGIEILNCCRKAHIQRVVFAADGEKKAAPKNGSKGKK